MLLTNKNELKNLDKSLYSEDALFQNIVKNLVPPVVYSLNQEFIDAFSEVVINFSPVSVNISDFWDRTPGETAYINKIKKEQSKDQWETYETRTPQSSENFMTLLADPNFSEEYLVAGSDQEYTDYVPNIDYGFHLNSTIKLKDTLAYIFMHNVYSIAEKAKRDTNLRSQLEITLKKMGLDTILMTNLNELFTENRFILNGEWVQKKGTKSAMVYSAHQAVDSEVQPYRNNSLFKFNITNQIPFNYQIESSIYEPIFEYFIKPLSHPIGYTYDYKMLCLIDGDYDYDNTGFDTGFRDFVLCKNVETVDSIKVKCLCDSDYEPCCNTFPDGSTIPTYDSTYETFTCTDDSGSQYGKWYVISCSDCSPDELLWDKIDQDNILDYTENGYIRGGDYDGWIYHKYVFQNGNYLIQNNRAPDKKQEAKVVVEYFQKDRTNVNYPNVEPELFARWNDGWQAQIENRNLREHTEPTLTDSIIIEQGKGSLLPFGFEDDPAVTAENYDNGEGPNPLLVVPEGWIYIRTDFSALDCSQKPRLSNAGFADYLPEPLNDPLGIAGVFYSDTYNRPCTVKNTIIGIKALYNPSNFVGIITPINKSKFGYQDDPAVTEALFQAGMGPDPQLVVPVGWVYNKYDSNGTFANVVGNVDPNDVAGTLE